MKWWNWKVVQMKLMDNHFICDSWSFYRKRSSQITQVDSQVMYSNRSIAVGNHTTVNRQSIGKLSNYDPSLPIFSKKKQTTSALIYAVVLVFLNENGKYYRK